MPVLRLRSFSSESLGHPRGRPEVASVHVKTINCLRGIVIIICRARSTLRALFRMVVPPVLSGTSRVDNQTTDSVFAAAGPPAIPAPGGLQARGVVFAGAVQAPCRRLIRACKRLAGGTWAGSESSPLIWSDPKLASQSRPDSTSCGYSIDGGVPWCYRYS